MLELETTHTQPTQQSKFRLQALLSNGECFYFYWRFWNALKKLLL